MASDPDTSKSQFPGAHSAISGHRYYSPSLGRFINRDPIEEQGGINLYSFVGNNPVNRWDLLGMIFQLEDHTPVIWGDGMVGAFSIATLGPITSSGIPIDASVAGAYMLNHGNYFDGATLTAFFSSEISYTSHSVEYTTGSVTSTFNTASMALPSTSSGSEENSVNHTTIAASSVGSSSSLNSGVVMLDPFVVRENRWAPNNTAPVYTSVSVGGQATLFVPAGPSSLGAGVTVFTTAAVTTTGNTLADKLGNAQFQVSVGLSPIVGAGGAAYVGAMFATGQSDQAPEVGGSANLTYHAEGGLGIGRVASGSVDWKPGSVTVSPPTIKPSLALPVKGGLAAYAGVGGTGALTFTTMSPQQFIQAFGELGRLGMPDMNKPLTY